MLCVKNSNNECATETNFRTTRMVLQNAISITVPRKHIIINHRKTRNKVTITLMIAWLKDQREKIGTKSTCVPMEDMRRATTPYLGRRRGSLMGRDQILPKTINPEATNTGIITGIQRTMREGDNMIVIRVLAINRLKEMLREGSTPMPKILTENITIIVPSLVFSLGHPWIKRPDTARGKLSMILPGFLPSTYGKDITSTA